MPTRGQARTWVAAIGLLAPSIAAAQDRSDREIVDLIVREGPQAAAIRADVEVTRREHQARLAWTNPSVTWSREGAGFTEFLQVEQALSLFGTRAALSDAGVAATTAAEAERDARLWLVRSDAAATAARLVAEQRRLELAQQHARFVERLVDIVRTREGEGEASRFDRVRAEQELREARLAVTDASAHVAEARAMLQALLPAGIRVTRLTSETRSQTAPALDTLLARAATARAELRALQQSAVRARFEARAARRSRLPSPGVFGGMKRADEAGERVTGGVLGLSVSIPLFDTGSRNAARWTADGVRLESQRRATDVRIRSEVSGAAEVLSLRQAALSEDQPPQSDELAQIAEVAYREGELGILEWLDAVRTTARARARRVDLELDARLAQIALERAVGESLWP